MSEGGRENKREAEGGMVKGLEEKRREGKRGRAREMSRGLEEG